MKYRNNNFFIENIKAEKIGFKPKLTSKEVVIRAVNEIFKENLMK